jgi:phosphotransferase system HPr-like phosphotransfer protein
MALAVKNGNEITMTFDGDDEEAARDKVMDFLKNNM